MKKINSLTLTLLLSLIFLGACEQEVIELTDPEPDLTNISPDPCGGAAGNANFTKFIAIGNSFVAGMQGGALFTDGQNNSLAAIINTQLACAGGTATFNQPSIRASLGWNLFFTQAVLGPPFDPTKPVLGRMRLQGTPPRPTPQAYAPGNFEAIPNPSVNPPFQYAGSTGAVATSALNNFAVPAITLGQALIPATGNWANPNPAVGFSPFYARFASNPGTSTILSDALSTNPTFFLFWLGLDDFFLHAAFGGDPTLAPLNSAGAFAGQYGAAMGAILASNANLKGVVGNFPDIFKMPHFTSVTYNPITLSATQVTDLNVLATNYNGFLDAMVTATVITADEANKRRLTFTAGAGNKILMNDETLTDLSAYMVGPAAGLLPYARARHSANTDIIPLSTGSVLGTPGSFGVLGVSEPVGDRYVLIPAEITAINTARAAFNTSIQTSVTDNPTRLALANIDAALNTLIANQAGVYNGVTITPNINPPTGIYSEDGAHMNTRGYAFLSRVFIQAINDKFGSTIPLTNISKYPATGLPLP
ncbi:MAG TPA: hypothetical protein PLV21_10880 [Cyclobacteriaceae bacterium]|nr:hypothetical protein [Cyclobacteriaceae bacterium]HRJ82382.1 hypothetical protein [Cyclobacteriaceae bacterium]